MILGLVWMVVGNAAVLLAARVAVRRCGTGRPAVDVVLFLLFRFAFIMALVLATGLAGCLTPLGLGVSCSILLAALLARGERLRAPWNLDLPREIPRWAVVFLTVFAARALLETLLSSPINGDAASYHLPKIAEWARTGRVLVDLGNDKRAWFPGGFELVEAWWVIFLHHDVLIEMAGLEFLLLSGAATWALANWLGVATYGSMIASLAVVTAPGLAMQSTSCLNDGPAAALVLAGAALIAHRAPLALLVFLGGIAAGVKPTTVYAAPGLLLLMLLVRKEPAPRPAPRSLTWLAAGLGLAVGLFWYTRTWIFTGSPIYPIGSDAMVRAKGVLLQRVGPDVHALLRNLGDLVNHRMNDSRRVYNPLLDYTAGWGALIVVCGLPALVWSLRSSHRVRALGTGFAVSLVTVLAQVVNDPFNLRFVLWFPALPALGLAWAIERGRRLAIPTALTMAFTLIATAFYGNSTFDFLRRHLDQDPWINGGSWRFDVHLVPRVGTFGPIDPSYAFYGPDFRNQVVYLRADDADALRREVLRHDLRILHAYTLPKKSKERRILDEAIRQGWLQPMNSHSYRVRR